MKIKKGVQTLGIRTELLIALIIADKIWENNGQDLVVTSLTEGLHGETSRHYLGTVADLRTRYFTEATIEDVADELREALGKDYLVLVESTHIHLSWKPRRS